MKTGECLLEKTHKADAPWVGGNREDLGLLHRFRFDSCCILPLLLVGMDAQIDLNTFALGSGLDEAADCRSGEALAPDESGNVRLAQDEAEVDFVISRVPDAEFRELGVLDKLEGDVLDEILELSGDCFHDVKFCLILEGARGNEKKFLPGRESICLIQGLQLAGKIESSALLVTFPACGSAKMKGRSRRPLRTVDRLLR